MNSDPENIVYSKSIIEFVTVSAEYSSYMENFSQDSKKIFINRLHKTLTLLYLKASLLPDNESVLDDSVEKFLTEEDWVRMKTNVTDKLGALDTFVEVTEPDSQIEDDEISVTVSECLADIYQDISDFIRLYQIGSEDIMNDALWECKQNFMQYWGPRLLVVLSVFHKILYSSDLSAMDDAV